MEGCNNLELAVALHNSRSEDRPQTGRGLSEAANINAQTETSQGSCAVETDSDNSGNTRWFCYAACSPNQSKGHCLDSPGVHVASL